MSFINFSLIFLQEPLFLMGLFSYLGLLLQGASWKAILKGSFATMLGLLTLQTGISLVNKSTKIFSSLFGEAFHLQGVIARSSLPTNIAFENYGMAMSLVVILSLFANMLFARITPWKYISLAHNWIYLCGMATLILSMAGFSTLFVVIIGSLLVGFLLTIFPAIVQPYTRQLTKNNSLALASPVTLSSLLAAWTGKLLGKGSKSAEDWLTKKSLAEVKNDQFGYSYIALIMSLLFFLLFLTASFITGTEFVQTLAGKEHWLVFIFRRSLMFAVGFNILLMGIRLFVEQLLNSFKGISRRLVPDAIPALASPVFFPYSPTSAFIGGMMSFVGQIAAMSLQLTMGWAVIFPIAQFSMGAIAGIYGNITGGIRGAILGSFVASFVTALLAGFFLPVLGGIGDGAITFSRLDILIPGFLLSWIL